MKEPVFFLPTFYPSFLYYLYNQPSHPTELHGNYKFEEPYTRNQELVEVKEFSSSMLISKENLTFFGLSIRSADSSYQAINEFDASAAQPDIIFSFYDFVSIFSFNFIYLSSKPYYYIC